MVIRNLVNMAEHDPCIGAYEHLNSLPRAPEALHSIRKIASVVKPIMRNRGWRVGVLTEFYPAQTNLLGININHGSKICLRLRYPGDKNQFLPIDEVIDTMLHELSHIVHGPHDERFHKLWNELRDEYQDLTLKGYTGEGFLSDGRRLGGTNIPVHEWRRKARAAAERRKVLSTGSGQRLGGAPVLRGTDMRQIIADAASRRTKQVEQTRGIMRGCASGTVEAENMADQASKNGFRTKAEEDDANDRAIAQALWELVQEDEARNAGLPDDEWKTEGLMWTPEKGLQQAGSLPSSSVSPSTVPKYIDLEDESEQRLTAPPMPVPPRPTPSRSPSNSAPKPLQRPKLLQASTSESKKRVFSSLSPTTSPSTTSVPTPAPPTTWSCTICTLVNPIDFLACDACSSECPLHLSQPVAAAASAPTHSLASDRPLHSTTINSTPSLLSRTRINERSQSVIRDAENKRRMQKLGWSCGGCGTFMETQWWTCSLCGRMKDVS